MPHPTPITIAHGDGIGPEIMDATLRVLTAAGAQLQTETIEIGQRVYERGVKGGIEDAAWASLRRTKVFLKAPVTTPQGGGFKSLNVTVRSALGLYANVRPCVAYPPFVATKHPDMDVVIIRENEEDTYAGIEYQHTPQVTECLKIITRPGSEKIVRYAFEYARANGRRKVTCFTKDNIMKMTDGLFHRIFEEIGAGYADIEKEHWIVDIGAAKLADRPELFDVVVMPNLYGDILSDVAAEIAGSVGLAGSGNIGEHAAMFEAIHGSAPRRAGQNLANPSGLLLGGVMMLAHIGQTEAAARAHNAFLRTLEDGVHTYDIFQPAISRQKVGTREFADAIIARMGQQPKQLKAPAYRANAGGAPVAAAAAAQAKMLVGADVYLDWAGGTPADLARRLEPLAQDGLRLTLITNRGAKVWPNGQPETFCTDHWRARFQAPDGRPATPAQVVALLGRITAAGLEFVQTANLYRFGAEPGYSGVGGA
ncbi:MAG: NADP-dependent isocitrate dehydrogenase [Terriglobales bacterium]